MNNIQSASIENCRIAAEEINKEFAGVDATVIDHRDCGEGIKIGINVGDANEIAEIMNDPPQRVALPHYGWFEVINGECLRFLHDDRMTDEEAEAYRLGWQ